LIINFNYEIYYQPPPTEVVFKFFCNSASINNQILHPNFITGFSDAESSFIIKFLPRPDRKFKWAIGASFQIGLHPNDLSLLNSIQSFFKGIGCISRRTNSNLVSFSVSNLDDLTNIIIPHFEKYPLQSAKSIDYYLWKSRMRLIRGKNHFSQNGLIKILTLKSALNRGLSKN
jgi:hypothetical protein